MSTFLFILGRKPLISLAEIIAIWGEKCIKGFEDELALVELDEEDPRVRNIESTLLRMGGTMKIAKVYQEFDREPSIETLIEKSYAGVHSRIMALKKVIFAANTYNLPQRSNKLVIDFLKIYKKYLTELGYMSRYLNKSNANVESAVALTENIIRKGVEFNFAMVEGKFYGTYTVAAQDFRLYAERDYHKPYRDNQAGMLPPKLAQIMIGLGEGMCKDVATNLLYDPFCGSGTILMESLLCRINCIGSDIRQETVIGAQENCEWIQKNFEHTQHYTFKTFHQDVTSMNPEEILKQHNPSMVVSESFLGPYFKKKPTVAETRQVQQNLGDLYKKAIQKFAQLHVPIVFAIAAHRNGATDYVFNEQIIEGIKSSGLKFTPLLPNWILKRFTPEQALTKGYCLDRHTLIYDREDAMVGREIFVLMPQ
ncbi:MAG: hypothetical protein NTX63_00550 [Candidatus Peregrinibacteria bacterium]|nr:hypothetical protein [Candidatus Peregrinibacteria bacterium]